MKMGDRAQFPSPRARTILFAVALAVVCACSSCGKKSETEKGAGETKKIIVRGENVAGTRVKWTLKTPGAGVSHPALGADGTIYIGTSQGVQAVSPEGREIWQVTYGGAVGPPVVSDDGTLYVESGHGLVFGVSADGKVVWKPQYGLIGFGFPPALGPGPTLYYVNATSDIYAFQPEQSEKMTWSLETFREGMIDNTSPLPGSARKGEGGQGSPAIVTADGTILVPRQNFLHSISPSGSRQWDANITTGTLGIPALGSDGTIYLSGRQGLMAVSPSGEVKWRFDAGVSGSPVVDADGVIYFTDGRGLFAVDADGKIKWRYGRLQDPIYLNGPALAADGTIYVGAEFALRAFRPDGTLKWEQRVYSPSSSPTIAPDGTVYFACGFLWLCAVQGDGGPLMSSSWPKEFHDVRNTSRYSPESE